jgi:hypothetical protein
MGSYDTIKQPEAVQSTLSELNRHWRHLVVVQQQLDGISLGRVLWQRRALLAHANFGGAGVVGCAVRQWQP